MHPSSSGGHYSVEQYSRHSSTCSCGRSSDSSPSLYRTSTRASSISTQSSSYDGAKFRYGGRGGAGSRARAHAPPPPLPRDADLRRAASASPLESQSSNLREKWLKRVASSEAAAPEDTATTPAPPIPIPTIALRRGTFNIPKHLMLQNAPSQAVPSGIQTPPLSAASAITTSTGTDSEVPRTPRSPYFYFDDPFETPSASESPFPSPSAPSRGMSRSLRRLASRTQQLFSKDIFLKAPTAPPTPTSPTPLSPASMPASPRSPTPPTSLRSSMSPTPPASLTSPSRMSVVTSEWYDPSEPPDSPKYPAPPPALLARSPSRPNREPKCVPESPVDVNFIDFPTSSGRNRSASEATLKSKSQGSGKKCREPRTHGEWNRGDMGEVIVSLRMLK